MSSFRSSPLVAAVVVLAGALVAVACARPAAPAAGDTLVDDSLSILDLNDDDTVNAPYDLSTDYTASMSGLSATVHTGGATKKPAVASGHNLRFRLDYTADTTGQEVHAILFKDPNESDVRDSDTRYRITFLKDGQIPQVFKDGEGEPSNSFGNKVPAGSYKGSFRGYKAEIKGAKARVWVQGRFKDKKKKMPHPSLRTYYELDAEIEWKAMGGWFYPAWKLTIDNQLELNELVPGGEKPVEAVMRPVLLDANGMVKSVMTHPYWKQVAKKN